MFKKLKDKITEEVKSSPQRIADIATSVQNLGAATAASSSKSPTTIDNNFTIVEEDQVTSSEGFTSVSFGDMPGPSSGVRRGSNSSIASDTSGFLPRFETSGSSVYHLQSDLDVSASEIDDSSLVYAGQLENISKESLYKSYRLAQTKYNKYRGRYTDLARHYKDLERQNEKAKTILGETQDKALRRSSELKEQCALEQRAKAHLEEALRMELDEKQLMIDALKQKVGLLQKAAGQEVSVSGEMQMDTEPIAPNETGKQETLNNQIELLKEEVKNARNELSAMHNQYSVQQIILEQVQCDLESRNQYILEMRENERASELLKNELRAVTNEYDMFKANQKQMSESLTMQMNNMVTEMKKKENEIEHLKALIQTTADAKAQGDAHLESVKKTAEEMRTEFQKIHDQYVQQKEAFVTEITALNNNAAAMNQAMEVDKNRLEQLLEEKKSILYTTEQKISKCTVELRASQEQSLNMTTEISELKKRNYKLSEELKKNKAIMISVEKRLEAVNREKVKLTRTLETERKHHEEIMDAAGKELTELTARVNKTPSAMERINILSSFGPPEQPMTIHQVFGEKLVQVAGHHGIVDILEERLREMQASNGVQLKQLVDSKMEEMKKLELHMEVEIMKLKDEIMRFEDEKGSLEAACNERDTKIAALESQLVEQGKLVIQLKQIIALKEQDLIKTRIISENKSKELIEKQNLITTYEQMMKSFEQHNSNVPNNKTAELIRTDTSVALLTVQLQHAQSEMKRLQHELSELTVLKSHEMKVAADLHRRELSKLRATVTQNNLLIDRMKLEIVLQREEIANLRSYIVRSEGQLDLMGTKRAESEEKVALVLEENKSLFKRLQNSKIEEDKLNFVLKYTQKCCGDLTEQMAEIKSHSSNLEAKLVMVDGEREKLKLDLHKKDQFISQKIKEVEKGAEEIAKLESSCNDVQLLLSESDDDRMAKETEINILNERIEIIEENSEEFKNAIESLNNRLAAEQERNNQIASSLTNAEVELTQTQAALEESERRCNELSDDSQDSIQYKEKLVNTTVEVDQLHADINFKSQIIADLTDKLQQLGEESRHQLAAKTNEVFHLTVLLEEKRRDCATFEHNFQKLERSYQTKETDLHALRASNVKLCEAQNEIESIRGIVKEKTLEINSRDLQIEQLKVELAAMREAFDLQKTKVIQMLTEYNDVNFDDSQMVLDNPDSDFEKLEETCKEVQKMLTQATRDKLCKETEINLLNEKLEILFNSNEQFKNEIEEMNRKLNGVEQKNIKIGGKFNDVEVELIQTQAALKETEKRCEKLTSDSKDINKFKEKTLHKKVEMDHLQLEVNFKSGLIAELSEKLEITGAQNKVEVGVKTAELEHLSQILNQKLQEYDNLEADVHQLEVAQVEQNTELQELQTANAKLREAKVEIELVRVLIEEKNSEIRNRDQQIDKLKFDLNAMGEAFEAEVTWKRAEIEDLEAHVEQLVSSKALEVEALQMEIHARDCTIQELTTQLERLSQEIGMSVEMNKESQKQIEGLYKTVNIYKAQVARLESLNSDLETMNVEVSAGTDHEMDTLQMENAKHTNMICNLEKQLLASQATLDTLEHETKSLQTQNKEYESQIALFKAAIIDANFTISQLKESLFDKETELQKFQQVLHDVNKEIDKLFDPYEDTLRNNLLKKVLLLKSQRAVTLDQIRTMTLELRDLAKLRTADRNTLLVTQQELENLNTRNEHLESKLQETVVALNHATQLHDSTELEYLRNILFKYMTGQESTVLARVIAAVCKFSDDETELVLQREQHRSTLLGQLGFI